MSVDGFLWLITMTVLLSYLYFTQIFPFHNLPDFYIYIFILYNNADDQTPRQPFCRLIMCDHCIGVTHASTFNPHLFRDASLGLGLSFAEKPLITFAQLHMFITGSCPVRPQSDPLALGGPCSVRSLQSPAGLPQRTQIS